MPETSHLQTDSALHAWARREAAKIPPLTAKETGHPWARINKADEEDAA